MSFALPYALLGLLAIPLLVAAYLWQLRRRRRNAVRFSNVALIRAVLPRQRMWRRHVPLALVLGSLALLGLAAGRPQVRAEVPVSSSAVILAVDVSGSMCATDVTPNRLAAAQEAVRQFIDKQDDRTRIGLVVFSGFAQVAVAPTTNKDDLLKAVDGLTTGRGTTIGAAILKSIDAISEINPSVAPADSGGRHRRGTRRADPDPRHPHDPGTRRGEDRAGDRRAPHRRRQHPRRHARGGRGPGGGPRGAGLPDRLRHHRAHRRWSAPATSSAAGSSTVRPAASAAVWGPGGRNFLVVDEEALQTVARTTGGEYFKASDADQLQGVLNDLPKHVDVQERDVEVSVAFAGLAALMLLLGLWLAGRWTAHPQ